MYNVHKVHIISEIELGLNWTHHIHYIDFCSMAWTDLLTSVTIGTLIYNHLISIVLELDIVISIIFKSNFNHIRVRHCDNCQGCKWKSIYHQKILLGTLIVLDKMMSCQLKNKRRTKSDHRVMLLKCSVKYHIWHKSIENYHLMVTKGKNII